MTTYELVQNRAVLFQDSSSKKDAPSSKNWTGIIFFIIFVACIASGSVAFYSGRKKLPRYSTTTSTDSSADSSTDSSTDPSGTNAPSNAPTQSTAPTKSPTKPKTFAPTQLPTQQPTYDSRCHGTSNDVCCKTIYLTNKNCGYFDQTIWAVGTLQDKINWCNSQDSYFWCGSTPKPTEMPTLSPTDTPSTSTPTESPTVPTNAPTMYPTKHLTGVTDSCIINSIINGGYCCTEDMTDPNFAYACADRYQTSMPSYLKEAPETTCGYETSVSDSHVQKCESSGLHPPSGISSRRRYQVASDVDKHKKWVNDCCRWVDPTQIPPTPSPTNIPTPIPTIAPTTSAPTTSPTLSDFSLLSDACRAGADANPLGYCCWDNRKTLLNLPYGPPTTCAESGFDDSLCNQCGDANCNKTATSYSDPLAPNGATSQVCQEDVLDSCCRSVKRDQFPETPTPTLQPSDS